MKFNSFMRGFENNCEMYASIVGRPIEQVYAYLMDVRKLDGYLPEGTFKRKLTSNELRLLDGFSNDQLTTYVSALSGCIAERVNHNIKPRRGRVQLSHSTELKICKKMAIKETLRKIIPDFEEIFESRENKGWANLAPGCAFSKQ